MCNSKSEDKRQRRVQAKNLNTHEESGGFHVVEVNSPINMSSSTWVIIIIIIAVIAFWYYKKYRRESKKETFKDAGGDPANKNAFNAWARVGDPQPVDNFIYPPALPPFSPFHQDPRLMLSPAFPPVAPAPAIAYNARPQLTYDARPALTYAPERFTEYAVPCRRSPPTRAATAAAPPPPTVPPPPPPCRQDAANNTDRSVSTQKTLNIAEESARRMEWDEIRPADDNEQ